MASTIARNLNLCFSKIKRPPLLPSPSPDHPNPPLPSPNNSTSTLFKNFNSLYDPSVDHHHHPTATTTNPFSDLESPDLAAIFASQRFFFSSPGRSNSITESSSSLFSASSLNGTSSSNFSPESGGLLGGGVPTPTFSPDPYMDFRRSMQEMVEARDLTDVRASWDYLHELLMCYLALNPKSTHKFIVGAFADLLISLMTSPVVDGGCCR